MVRRRWPVLIFALIASPAEAQDGLSAEPDVEVRTPSEEAEERPEDAEARALFAAGARAFAAGRYDDAARDFSRAYDLSERPAFLFNLGLAQDRLERHEQALESYRHYRQAVPDASNAATVDARMEELAILVAAREGEERRRATREGPGVWPWIVMGAGGVLLAAGAIVHVLGRIDMARVESPSGPEPRWADVAGAADRAPVLMNVGLVLGGVGFAAVAGGLLWLVIGSGPGDREAAAVTVAPGGAGLRGTF